MIIGADFAAKRADDIIKTARNYLDVPFRHRGRNTKGLDCAGLIIRVLTDCDCMPAKFHECDYHRIPKPHLLYQTLDKIYLRLSEPEPGAILLLTQLNQPIHLAIYSNDNTIIHAYEPRKKVVEEEYSEKWQRLLFTAYQIEVDHVRV